MKMSMPEDYLKMRKLYIYEVIRYYPNINGDEFFNIGIRLSDKNKLHKTQFIEEEHLSYIYRFPSIKKQVIDRMIEELKASENSVNNWYGNYVRFSSEKLYRSKESFDHVIQKLYEDFIGYKFHRIDKEDKLQKIKRDTKKIIKKEFKHFLTIQEDKKFDFVIATTKNKVHRVDIGSANNREHVNKMIWLREEYQLLSKAQAEKFDFLNMSDSSSQVAETLLTKNEIDLYAYADEESRYQYLRQIINN